jgi:hypothetical protein
MSPRTSLPKGVGAAVLVCALVGAIAGSAMAFTSWTVVGTPNPGVYGNLLKGVSARTATDAWAVGATATSGSNQPLIQHWNGTSWTNVPAPSPVPGCQDGNIQWAGNTLNGVAAVSGTDVWAVGHTCYTMKTLAEHWNGSAWSIVPSPSFATGGDGIQNTLNGVAAVSGTNVWAVGSHTASNGAYVTLVEHWNGSSWSVVPSPSPSSTANGLNGVAGYGTSDVWAVGYQNGTGSQPLIEHWNGTSWAVVPSPARPGGSVLNAVTVLSSTNVWAVGSQPGSTGAPLTLVEHWNGTSWSVVSSPNLSAAYGSANVLRGVAAISATNIWAVGMVQNSSTNYHQHRTFTLHWNGLLWSVVTSPTPGASGELNAVAALSTGQLWAAGLYSPYNVNIYDGSYTAPRTLMLAG